MPPSPISHVTSHCDSSDLKILYYNSRSIVHKLETSCLLYKPDIICITETWLHSEIQDTELCIPNYELIRLDRDRHGGGVAIYVANHLPYITLVRGPYSLEFLCISVKYNVSKTFIICVFYRPPSSPVSLFDTFSLVLEELCIPMYSTFLIFGDFNVDVSTPNYLCKYLHNVIHQHALSITPTGYTRVTDTSMTTIDLVLSTSPELFETCETIPPIGTSDHYGIFAKLSLATTTPLPQAPRKIWRYNLADFDRANDLLSQVDPSTIIVENDMGKSWSNWITCFLHVMEECILNRTLPKQKNLPWLIKSIIQLMRKRDMYFKRSRMSPHYLLKYRRTRNRVTYLLRSSRKKFFRKLKSGSKQFWKAIKSLKRGSSTIPTL